MKAVIYARFSSDRQNEQSIDGQLRDCHAYAKAHDMLVVNEYIDRALTGRSDDRPAFQKMIADAAKKQFDRIIVWKLDRFSRNRYDSATYKARLKKHGVRVISATENISEEPEGIMMEGILESMAEYYSANLAKHIKRGMRESALKGQVTGGGLALGYKIGADKRFEIDEKTAPIVQQIFTLYNEGKTVTEICAILNGQGVKTSRGADFNKNSLRTILQNRKYIGEYRCGDVVTPGGVPAIIDNSLFESVAIRMQKNKKAPAKAKAEVNYMLTTKIFCGLCETPMLGDSGTGRGDRKYHYYTCGNRKREKACDLKSVQKDWIERLVIQNTIDHILKDDVIAHIADQLVALQEKEAAENNTLKYLESALTDAQKAAKNLLAAIEQGLPLTDTTKERIAELEDQKQSLEVEIAKEKIVRKLLTKDQIIFWVSRFKGGDIEDEKYCQNLIDTFVNSVWVFPDKVIITYNFSGDGNKITVSDLDKTPPPQRANPNHPLLFVTTKVFGLVIGR